MLTMNHTAVYFLKALRAFEEETKDRNLAVKNAVEYIDKNVSLLLLPDAIRMYGPRQQFHFTEHPVTHEVSSVKFNTTPDKLKGIKDAFEADLKADIPKCVIDEMSHPEVFAEVNPTWAETAYATHLYQDCAWDKWIREMVFIGQRFDDKFSYYKNGREVNGSTFRQELGPLDNVFFQEIAKQIYAEFGVLLNEDWFEKHVYANFLRDYDKELADNTWKYIKLPSLDENLQLPDFVPEGELSEAVTKMTEATVLF